MKKTIIISLIGLISACSSQYATNADKQYAASKNGRTLVIPKPLTEANINHFYDLPNVADNSKVSKVDIAPS